jgi:polyphenol oxidase
MMTRNPSRRELCAAFGAAAAVGFGVSFRPAAAQDNPDDCAPIGADGKNPVPYKPDPSLPVRIRKSAFELSRAEVDRLKEAYAAFRQLTKQHPDDPRGWLRGSYVHCWYCGGGNNNEAGEEIHGSWYFFPWHRAYLHFHERILGKLIKDDTFAMPYWDWDSEGRQRFPSVFGDPNDAGNPLADMLRSANANSAISNQAVSVKIMNTVMNSPNNSLFMGSQNNSGALENAPHGPVHIWTADTTLQAANNDMGVLATAAQDPVFFAHHGNIDRLWGVWLGLAPGMHKNFTESAWTQHSWQFYNEDAVWTQITIADVLDSVKSLRSDYAKPSAKPIWTYKPRAAPAAAAAIAENQPTAPPLVISNASAPIALATSPVTREIGLPAVEAQALSELTGSSPAQYVLYLRGIEVPKTGQAMFNVFLNLPDATSATSSESPNFAGTVTILARIKDSRSGQPVTTNTALDVTDVLRAAKNTETLSVTLVPVAAEGAAPSESHATVAQISIERF